VLSEEEQLTGPFKDFKPVSQESRTQRTGYRHQSLQLSDSVPIIRKAPSPPTGSRAETGDWLRDSTGEASPAPLRAAPMAAPASSGHRRATSMDDRLTQIFPKKVADSPKEKMMASNPGQASTQMWKLSKKSLAKEMAKDASR